MMRCSPEAFAKCPTSHLCGSLGEATFAEGSECDAFNEMALKQPRTNADRIRAMSDVELAELLRNAYDAGCDDASAWECGKRQCTFTWDEEWLQQPAEEVVK